MGQLASNGKTRCNLRRGVAPNLTMTMSALRRHKSDAEGDDDDSLTSDASTAAGPAVDYLASMPEWDWNLRAMHSSGLPPTAV